MLKKVEQKFLQTNNNPRGDDSCEKAWIKRLRLTFVDKH